jgi:glycosyltransferase involved in cell wall biosynthesis
MKKDESGFFTLAYAGRISRDKNLDFLLELFGRLNVRYTSLRGLMAGDGPYLEEVKNKTKGMTNVLIMNEIEHARMPEVYAKADLFLFPSTTDTFGMVVLEAQACGVPAIVSDEGGPKEIIADKETGLVAYANNMEDWLHKTSRMIELAASKPAEYARFSEAARTRVMSVFNWDKVLRDIFAKNKAENTPEKSGSVLREISASVA